MSLYRKHLKKLRQGDIALCEFHQLRARSGEGRGPGDPQTANENTPYFGEPQDFEIPVSVPGHEEPMPRILRVWVGPVVVVSQSCELEYSDPDDARILVAPIVSQPVWSNGPWERIEGNALPGYMYLPPIEQTGAEQLDLASAWPAAAVAIGSTTLISKAMVRPNRIMTLSPRGVTDLQAALVRFMSVRGWGDLAAATQLTGKRIVDVKETIEMVPGPSRLTKVMLEDDDGGDEITVVCGLRPGRRAA